MNMPPIVLALACLPLLCTHRSAGQDVRVGVASVDITPPQGTPLAGYYHARGADGVLDPLLSKALVIESNGMCVALVTLDIISVTREITDQARQQIEQAVGIPGDHVMISATHAHTGPQLTRRDRRGNSLGGSQPLAVEYTEKLPTWIAQTVQAAHQQLAPVRVRAAWGQCEGLAFNRRYFMRDGSVGWNPGKNNPHIVLPAGPTDPQLTVLYVEQPDARGPAQGIATYVNFAMHTDTTGGSKISADWPGALSRILQEYHGPHHTSLLGNGASGNVNHLDFNWDWPQTGPFEQHRIGVILAASVLQAYKDLQPVPTGPLQAKREIVELALPDIPPEEVAQARQLVEATPDDRTANFLQLVEAYRAIDVANREGQPLRVEVQAIAWGQEVAWVALPGEVFVELGLAIKKRSPFPITCVVTLANENIGYIPDRRSYAEGNYEAVSARCAAGSGERIVDAACRLLDALRAAP